MLDSFNHGKIEPQINNVDHIIDQLIELGREHKTAVREQTTLTNMLKARVREYVGYDALKSGTGESISKMKAAAAYKRLLTDKEDPLFLNRVSRIMAPRDKCKTDQNNLAKAMGKLAMQLPVWEWAEQQKGFGAPMLGKFIAEAGRDLGMYGTPAKLFKRFGEHVVDGKAPKAQKGVPLGFSKYRRSVSFQLGDALLKAGGSTEKGTATPWRKLYEHRKQFEIDRAVANGLKVVPAAKINDKNREGCMSEGHVHNRAMRYMRKKFIESLWQEWTGSYRDMNLPDFITD